MLDYIVDVPIGIELHNSVFLVAIFFVLFCFLYILGFFYNGLHLLQKVVFLIKDEDYTYLCV